MTAITVTPISQSVKAWQITPLNAGALVDALNSIAASGYTGSASCAPGTSTTNWALTVSKPVSINQAGTIGSWIVFDGQYATVFQTNQEFISAYTANVPMTWGATTVAPVATPESGLKAVLSFPQPTSANAPWTYSVTGAGTAGPFTTDGNGNVTVTISGLTAGTQYSWTVAVSTQYVGVNATSLASNTVTAIT